MIDPETHQVAQVIVEEMMKWKSTANEEQRRQELYALSDRLIRYFGVFYSTVEPLKAGDHPGAIVPGLPGGQPFTGGRA